jgi:hypothetical protein
MREIVSLLDGFASPFGRRRSGATAFSPSSIFANGESGTWYDPSDLSMMFQDTAGTTPITASGQTIARVNDKSGNGLNTTQATTSARPSYIVDADGAFIQHDPIDDALTVTLPDLGTKATVAYVTRSEVRLLEDQTISGSYTLPAQEIANFVVIDRALTFSEKVSLIRFLASKVAGVNYGAEIDRLTLIAINAVDVFVYDTSKDSDGGAWRTGALAQASSWYNETLNTATRGSRREFPAVAVIVAEADKVTIYDGDDPTLPMWMVFTRGFKYSIHNAAAITSISMLNGELRVGEAGSGIGNLSEISFLADKSGMRINSTVYYYIRSALSQRNTSVSTEGTIAAWLVNRDINDVAMTVLPDAPIDPATGLPVPTIAVATDGGVSVIKDDGAVVDIVATTTNFVKVGSVQLDGDTLYASFEHGALQNVFVIALQIPNADISASFAFNIPGLLASYLSGTTEDLDLDSSLRSRGPIVKGSNFLASRSISGSTLSPLCLISEDLTAPTKGMICYVSSTYTTGWMNGDIKGAFLADTDDTDLVGSGELVVNGGFDDGLTGWVDFSEGAGSISVADGRLSLVNGGAVNGDSEGMAYQMVPTVVGQRYQVTVDKVSGSSIVQIGYGAGVAQYFQSGNDSNDVVFSFVAATTTTFITIRVFSANTTAVVEAVSVRIADADRSVNARGLVVNGTITRAPVAPGAELVAYNGFSASNYLEQPYNPDLDFGTGDFCVMGWVKVSSSATAPIVSKGVSTKALYIQATSNKIRAWLAGSLRIDYDYPAPANWTHIAVYRSGDTLFLALNGLVVETNVATLDTDVAGATLRIGRDHSNNAATTLSASLLRISATAPTAEQILKIYNDEKVLFQDNAQATLYGASDSVTALAYDEDTDLLHVGTSAGRSIFNGLRRINNTTTGVTTAISATNGVIAEQ